MDVDPPGEPRSDDSRIAGRYRLRERLGFGGFAEVWAATDEVLTRPVAVKRLLPHLLNDPHSVRRFRREAVALARVNHPGVVAVFDTVSRPDCQAIVMELIDGDSLRGVLERDGILDPTTVIDLGMQVFDALEAAHRHGLVHRDVSPANLLVGDDGVVRLTDFGLASSDDRAQTMLGGLSGTAAYVAPEQVAGAATDARADVYSAAAVLYEAACGQPPFERPTEAATMLARLTDEVIDPRHHRPALPDGLAEVLLRCLARAPEDRPASAAEVSAELRGVAAALRRPSPSLAVGELVGASLPAAPLARHRTLVTVPPSGSPAEPSAAPSVVGDPQATPTVIRRRRAKAAAVEHAPGTPSQTSRRRSGSPTVAGPARSPRNHKVPRSARPAGVGVAAVLVIAGAALLVIALLGDPATRGTSPGNSAPPVIEPIAAVAVTTLDPRGTGQPGENDDRASRLVDGDPESTWITERYLDPRFGTKPGVGVAVTLEADVALIHLTIASRSAGWRAEVSATDGVPEGLPPPGRIIEGSTGDVRVDLRGMRGRVINLWITQLGDTPGGHAVEWAEIAVTGRR